MKSMSQVIENLEKYAVNMRIKRENDVKFKKINNLKENIRKLKNSVDKCQTIIYT